MTSVGGEYLCYSFLPIFFSSFNTMCTLHYKYIELQGKVRKMVMKWSFMVKKKMQHKNS